MATYVVDFFNVFSDYRETYYNKFGVDFHTVKYKNIRKDTVEFFDLFFSTYITAACIPIESRFIFVMKRIHNYESCIQQVLEKYSTLTIKFIIVQEKYTNKTVDDNKDDFMCQYLLATFPDSILISNDKYTNNIEYTSLFLGMREVRAELMCMSKKCVVKARTLFVVNKQVITDIINTEFERTSVPKKRFDRLYTPLVSRSKSGPRFDFDGPLSSRPPLEVR